MSDADSNLDSCSDSRSFAEFQRVVDMVMRASQVTETAEKIREKLKENPELLNPQYGIICGSGLSTLGENLTDRVLIPYKEIPGFALSTVPGHKSYLMIGKLGATVVVAMLGRIHFYEGHDMDQVTYPVRVFAALGCHSVIITNASGSLREDIATGTIAVVHDHLSFPSMSGNNPCRGPVWENTFEKDKYGETRFLPLSNLYDINLRRKAFQSAKEIGIGPYDITAATYAWVSGPTYETPAEARLLRMTGADLVGMSTVPEAVIAHYYGLKVLVLSLVTNQVAMPLYADLHREVYGLDMMTSDVPTSIVNHAEVLSIGQEKAELMRRLVERIIQ